MNSGIPIVTNFNLGTNQRILSDVNFSTMAEALATPIKREGETYYIDGSQYFWNGTDFIAVGSSHKVFDTMPTPAQVAEMADGDLVFVEGVASTTPGGQTPGGGGIEEAPLDGKLYGRKDGDWEEIVESDPIDIPPSINTFYPAPGVESDTGMTWHDGRIIFRRVYQFTMPPGAGGHSIDTGVAHNLGTLPGTGGVGRIISIQGTISGTGGSGQTQVLGNVNHYTGSTDPAAGVLPFVSIMSGTVRLTVPPNCFSNLANYTILVVIEYTRQAAMR